MEAQTTQPVFSADIGFGGVFRPDAWVPIYVRLVDTVARPATLEVRTVRGRLGHSISARISTATVPATYTLYAPLGGLDRASLQLRDANGKLIRALDLTDQAQQSPAALGGPAIGISSPVDAAAQRVATQLIRGSEEYVAAGTIATGLLPERAIGYACLDVLVMPELDTDTLGDDIESAVLAWVRTGGIVVAWRGALPATIDSPLRAALPEAMASDVVDLSDVQGRALARRMGLGQIVLCDFDPSTVPAGERLTLWRHLTGGQVSMSPDDRRVGVFDPLLRQAVAEQALRVQSASSAWTLTLWRTLLLLGLIAGPGEAVILIATRRPPMTWYMLGGGALLAATTIAILMRRESTVIADARIEVSVEVERAVVERLSLAANVHGDDPITWLTGDRPDAADRPAAELRLGQHDDHFVPLDADGILSIGGERAKVRSFTDSPATSAAIAVDAGPPTHLTNRSPAAWEAIAIASRGDVRIQNGGVAPGATVECVVAPVPADIPDTRRVETGVERVAATPGWEALFFDRRLAERLVRLQETEPTARIIVTRSHEGATRHFDIRVERATP